MGFLVTYNKGRLGNCIFRFLASRLFVIFYTYIPIKTMNDNYYQEIDDTIFKNICRYLLNNGSLPPRNTLNYDYLLFNGYYQNDFIYNFYKKEIIQYIKNNPDETIETDRNEIYYAKDILGDKKRKKKD